MAAPDRHALRTVALDPVLLATPYDVRTHWHVLTGPACCGKTTLVDMLSQLGRRTIPESARLYFDAEMGTGRTLEEIRSDGAGLQRGIARLQLRLENDCPSGETVFLDRAIPDSITFYRVYGLDPNEILPGCFKRRYATVFLLDRLPVRRARVLGPEDDFTSEFLCEWLERDYGALGYPVVRVPVLRPEERLAFLLERLAGRP